MEISPNVHHLGGGRFPHELCFRSAVDRDDGGGPGCGGELHGKPADAPAGGRNQHVFLRVPCLCVLVAEHSGGLEGTVGEHGLPGGESTEGLRPWRRRPACDSCRMTPPPSPLPPRYGCLSDAGGQENYPACSQENRGQYGRSGLAKRCGAAWAVATTKGLFSVIPL